MSFEMAWFTMPKYEKQALLSLMPTTLYCDECEDAEDRGSVHGDTLLRAKQEGERLCMYRDDRFSRKGTVCFHAPSRDGAGGCGDARPELALCTWSHSSYKIVEVHASLGTFEELPSPLPMP